MRTATILAWGQIDWWPENLFRGCCPCICLTLKLLSQLWLVVRDCVFIFSLTKESAEKRRESERWSWLCVPIHTHTHTCVSWCAVRCCQSVCGFYACLCGCVVFACAWKTVRVEGRKQRKQEREERDALCQSILALENSRSSFHVLPTSGQSVSNQSGA